MVNRFTNTSNQIESDDVSASVTVLVATTDDVTGNRTVSHTCHIVCVYLEKFLQLSVNFFDVVDNNYNKSSSRGSSNESVISKQYACISV